MDESRECHDEPLAGTGPTGPNDPEGDTGMERAVPEGAFIASTSPPQASPSRFLFVGNYCGEDRGGDLLVQNISNLAGVRAPQRIQVPVYDHLGTYTENEFTPTSGSSARLSAEVPSTFFKRPPGGDSSGVNKIRPVSVVNVTSDTGYANRDRQLLFIGVNLDPVRLDACGVSEYCYPSTPVPLDIGGQDDGKYDYLAIVDITDMVAAFPNPWPCTGNCPDLWRYDDGAEWAARMRFLRLPPDLPANWILGATSPPNDALQAGDDWGMVAVPDPLGGADASLQVVGGGTISSITSDPDGRAVYIVSNDQADLQDGGEHIPHLYVLDLFQGDFTDQTFLDGYTPNVASYRFNKVIRNDFGNGNMGAINVASTIPGMPITGAPSGPTLLQLPGPDNNLGTVYPGENQLDVKGSTRLIAVHNPNLAMDVDRLYIGLGGRAQTSSSTAKSWPLVGAVLVLSLSNPTQPSYLRTLTIPHVDPSLQVPAGEWYQVAGLDVLPPDAAHIGTGVNAQRNVFVVTAQHTKQFSQGPIDRLVIGEDL